MHRSRESVSTYTQQSQKRNIDSRSQPVQAEVAKLATVLSNGPPAREKQVPNGSTDCSCTQGPALGSKSCPTQYDTVPNSWGTRRFECRQQYIQLGQRCPAHIIPAQRFSLPDGGAPGLRSERRRGGAACDETCCCGDEEVNEAHVWNEWRDSRDGR